MSFPLNVLQNGILHEKEELLLSFFHASESQVCQPSLFLDYLGFLFVFFILILLLLPEEEFLSERNLSVQ